MFPVDLATFTEEILNGEFIILLCSACFTKHSLMLREQHFISPFV